MTWCHTELPAQDCARARVRVLKGAQETRCWCTANFLVIICCIAFGAQLGVYPGQIDQKLKELLHSTLCCTINRCAWFREVFCRSLPARLKAMSRGVSKLVCAQWCANLAPRDNSSPLLRSDDPAYFGGALCLDLLQHRCFHNNLVWSIAKAPQLRPSV